jgi:hypothetical protein
MTIERPMFPPRAESASNVVKFPFGVSRRACARRPRKSINGTSEERAASRETVAEEINAQIDNRPPAGSLSTTGENGRLRKERHEVWRMAAAATRYWRVRLDFDDAVSWVQRMGTGRPFPPRCQSRRPRANGRKVPRSTRKAASHSRTGCCVGQMEANGASQGPTSIHRREIRTHRTRNRRRFGISRRASGASIKPAKAVMKRRRRSTRKRYRQRLAAHAARIKRRFTMRS